MSTRTTGPYHRGVGPDGRRHYIGRRDCLLYTACGKLASWSWHDDLDDDCTRCADAIDEGGGTR